MISDKNKTKIAIINGKVSANYEKPPRTEMAKLVPWMG